MEAHILDGDFSARILVVLLHAVSIQKPPEKLYG